MGGGASLDKSQNALLTRELKTEYENIAKNHPDFNDETVKGLLEQKYQEVVASFLPPAEKSSEKKPDVASPSTTIKKDAQRGGGIKAVPSKKSTLRPDRGGTRRRSFGDEKDNMPQKASAAAALAIVNSYDKIGPDSPVALAQSQSTPSIEPAQTNTKAADSWDSVDQQPYCKLCAMAFKTISFLERHVKYSDMHAKAKKKLSDAESLSKSSNNAENTEMNNLQEKQQEGVHYRMVYSGSKLFWRTQETIDIDMYYHIIPDAVEIIFFDEAKGRELPRLYLNNTKLMTVVNAIVDKEVTEKIELIKKDQQQNKFSKIDTEDDKMIMELPDVKEFIEDTRRKAFTKMILSRLQLSFSVITYVANTGDDPMLQIVLPIQPNGLIPVPVHRRRRTNSDEINKTILNLEVDREALKAATGKAERIADFIHQSISLFANAKNIYKGLSVPRKRWVFAIRKTILMASLIKTKVRLEEIRIAKEKKDAIEKMGGRKRSIVRPKEI